MSCRVQTFIVQEAKNKHQQVNPLVDQRLRQTHRRVQVQVLAQPPSSELAAPPAFPSRTSSTSSAPSALSLSGKSLDVSFKRSLVASYERVSYTGTGAGAGAGASTAAGAGDCAEETWQDWLCRRQGRAAPTAGGVVDDILRLVPLAICSESLNCLAADSCLYDAAGLAAFGAFSALARQQSLAQAASSRVVCSADVLGLMSDVLDSHVCCAPAPPSSTAGAASAEYEARLSALSREVYSLSDDFNWQCVSGSSDLLTVLAATSFNLAAQEVTVAVRVVNSAMFKVPVFSVQVCLQGAQGGAASFQHAALPCTQEGVEYFLPGEHFNVMSAV